MIDTNTPQVEKDSSYSPKKFPVLYYAVPAEINDPEIRKASISSGKIRNGVHVLEYAPYTNKEGKQRTRRILAVR